MGIENILRPARGKERAKASKQPTPTPKQLPKRKKWLGLFLEAALHGLLHGLFIVTAIFAFEQAILAEENRSIANMNAAKFSELELKHFILRNNFSLLWNTPGKVEICSRNCRE
jgi:hypothetical protein